MGFGVDNRKLEFFLGARKGLNEHPNLGARHLPDDRIRTWPDNTTWFARHVLAYSNCAVPCFLLCTCVCSGGMGLVSDDELTRYRDALQVADTAYSVYRKCFVVDDLLRDTKLNRMRHLATIAGHKDWGEEMMGRVLDALLVKLLVRT